MAGVEIVFNQKKPKGNNQNKPKGHDAKCKDKQPERESTPKEEESGGFAMDIFFGIGAGTPGFGSAFGIQGYNTEGGPYFGQGNGGVEFGSLGMGVIGTDYNKQSKGNGGVS